MMQKICYRPPPRRGVLHRLGSFVLPAIRRITYARPMPQYPAGPTRAIHHIDARPGIRNRVDINSAQKIVREVVSHIFLRSRGNIRDSPNPVAHFHGKFAQRCRQCDWIFAQPPYPLRGNTVSYAGRYQQQDPQNQSKPHRRLAGKTRRSPRYLPRFKKKTLFPNRICQVGQPQSSTPKLQQTPFLGHTSHINNKKSLRTPPP